LIIGGGIAVTLLVRYFRGPDRASYVAKNERILAALPRPSGAKEIGGQILASEDCWGEQLCHTVGYTSHVSYRVPLRMTQEDVVRFYRLRMHGWRPTSWSVDGTLFACFDRRQASVAISTDGMELLGGARQKSYEISADHNGGSCD
jgi:hypothetical protein